MDGSSSTDMSSFSLLIGTGATTVVLAAALAYVLLQTRKSKQAAQEAAQLAAASAPKVVDKEEYPGGLLTVYYATQTGTSESFARQLEREAPDHGFFVHVVDLEDIDILDLVEEPRKDAQDGTARAVFLTATYGEGEAPDNATLFAEALGAKAETKLLGADDETDVVEPTLFADLCFCVFGLGNRQYDHFNAMGKFFDRVLARLGGTRVLPLGLGDDDNDLEGDFEAWKDNQFWPAMEKKFLHGAKVPTKKSGVQLPDCQIAVEYHQGGTKPRKIPLDQVHSSSRHYFDSVDCPVTTVRELRSANDGDSTVHVEVDISKAKGVTYQTADNLGVLPLNSSDVVESVAKSLGYDLETVFSVKAAGNHEWHGAPFPMPLTIREFLTRYCDLTGPPRRSELKLIAAFAKDPLDQKALLRLSSKDGKAEYKEKVTDALTGLVHILQRCPSIEMPLEYFVDLCPRLQPRFFTISSSSSVHPKSVHLTVAVTKKQRVDGTLFQGVCSTFLAKQKPAATDKIRVFVRPSSFRLPLDASKPILMIGPGTGVAPMRAFLQERANQKKKGAKVGPNILYFGCKKAEWDYLYREEMEAWQKDGSLSDLYIAFSRAQAEKVYVQHLLQKNSRNTWNLLENEGAYVYVCGAVQMGHDVGEALQKIVTEHSQRTSDQAKAYLSKLAEEGRYVQELWA